jgi:hypothetical protein
MQGIETLRGDKFCTDGILICMFLPHLFELRLGLFVSPRGSCLDGPTLGADVCS